MFRYLIKSFRAFTQGHTLPPSVSYLDVQISSSQAPLMSDRGKIQLLLTFQFHAMFGVCCIVKTNKPFFWLVAIIGIIMWRMLWFMLSVWLHEQDVKYSTVLELIPYLWKIKSRGGMGEIHRGAGCLINWRWPWGTSRESFIEYIAISLISTHSEEQKPVGRDHIKYVPSCQKHFDRHYVLLYVWAKRADFIHCTVNTSHPYWG